MDAASSEWKSEKGKGYYKLPKAGTEYTSEELIGTGPNYAKNIRSSLSKTVWMKKTGKDGRNLQPDLVTKYSLSVTTCLLQIQKDLQKVSALVQVMRF